MAKKKVIVEGQVILDDNGTLKKITKGSRQADRALKGTAKTSSSGTKNFSKMSQGITGGLVPAYATLAANLFAITAVFAALKEAADLRVMREGMEQYAASTGIAMQGIAASLQQVTHMQLNYGEAMKATATLSAAGFGQAQILEMGQAARQASAALGHNFEDAFNRITKGIQKAEPELLDELGIILRLDQATRNYAIANGLAQDDLTLFQRTMAVHNEVISQATEKYGSLNKEIKVSGIVQLGTAFENVKKSALESFAPIAEFFAGVFQKNIALVIAVMITFGVAMLKAAGIGDMLGDKVTSWTTNAAAKVTAARVAQEDYTHALKMSKLEAGKFREEAAGQMQGAALGKGKNQQIGKGDFKGKKRLMAGQIGMLPHKLLREWQKTEAGVVGVTENMTAKQKRAFDRYIDDVIGGEKKFEREWKHGWKRMTLGAELALAKVKSAVATVGSGIGKVVGFMGKLAGGLMSIVGKLAMFKMLWEMGKGLAKDAHNYTESFLNFAKKFPLFEGWADKMLDSTESWRDMREHSKIMGEQMERITSVNDNMEKQKEEVQSISDNWNTAASQLEKYIMLGRLLDSIDFSASIAEAVTAYKTAEAATADVMTKFNERVAGLGNTEQYNRITPGADTYGQKATGPRTSNFLTSELALQSGQALTIHNTALVEAGKAALKDADALAWKEAYIDFWDITDQTKKVVVNNQSNQEVMKTSIDQIIEDARIMITQAEKLATDSGLNFGMDPEIMTKAYEDALKAGETPAEAARIAGEAFNKAKKPLTDFVGEMDSLKSITEAYNKTANKLYKKVMPQGYGKQFKTLQDFQNVYGAGIKKRGDEEGFIGDDTKMDVKHLKMLDSMNLLDKEMYKRDEDQKILWEDMLVTWKQMFGDEGNVTKAQNEAYKQAWGYEELITEEKLKQVNLQHAGMKLKGAMGKRYQYEYNVAKLESQMEIKKQELLRLENADTPKDKDYDQKVANIELANTGLQKQLEIMKKQETIQFKLTDMFQQGFENLFTSLVKGEEKLGEVFKKVTSQMLAQMAAMMAQQAALRAFGMAFPGMSSYLGGRDGGIFSSPGYRSFGDGGIASGSDSGYTATLHGTEAVVPLGNDRSIPVKLSGNAGTSNITVNVSTTGGQQTTSAGGGQSERKLGQMIAAAVQGEILDQQRPGGILSPYGDGGP